MGSKLLLDSRHRAIIGFLLKAILLYITWFVSYDFFIAPNGSLDSWLDHRLATDASSLLRLVGYSSDTIPGIRQTLVRLNGVSMIGVGNPCNGLELFVLFAGFILCFSGNYLKKILFIVTGILLIHLINVLRTIALTLIQFKSPENLEFNHHYTFTIVVYLFIFYMWMIWVNKYSGVSSKIANKKD